MSNRNSPRSPRRAIQSGGLRLTGYGSVNAGSREDRPQEPISIECTKISAERLQRAAFTRVDQGVFTVMGTGGSADQSERRAVTRRDHADADQAVDALAELGPEQRAQRDRPRESNDRLHHPALRAAVGAQDDAEGILRSAVAGNAEATMRAAVAGSAEASLRAAVVGSAEIVQPAAGHAGAGPRLPRRVRARRRRYPPGRSLGLRRRRHWHRDHRLGEPYGAVVYRRPR
ncbi:hypothetical protein AB0J80_37660 [Actinoplanes sp. NPDC049548]|uniref:hypothetical protein n=1 Tax=Actinoplanes sp. NPDC049548 TaxID=3155152 RepID=UPI003413B547